MKSALLLIALSLSNPSMAVADQLMLFGGKGHKTFVGCVGCSEYETGSICNRYGKGSKYDSDGIFNRYGAFGSKYSDANPWNKYSTSDDVPVLVDSSGQF